MDIAVALGGGGARGNAHIGVIRCLEENGFRIKAVAGTSAGGIIAAFYAAGFTTEEMEIIYSKVDQSRLYGRSSDDGPGILGLSYVEKWLGKYFGDKRLEELPIKCGLTAVDIKCGQEVVFSSGLVIDAVLATIAIPGIFPPRMLEGHPLVDGAVLDPVPVSVARSLAKGLPIVAVALNSAYEDKGHLSSINLPGPIPRPIYNRLLRTRLAQAFDIFLSSVDISSQLLTELRLKIDKPDIIIKPDVGHIGILDKIDVHQVIKLGEEATNPHIKNLKIISIQRNSFFIKLKRFIGIISE